MSPLLRQAVQAAAVCAVLTGAVASAHEHHEHPGAAAAPPSFVASTAKPASTPTAPRANCCP